MEKVGMVGFLFLEIVVYPTITTTGKYTRNGKNFPTRVGLL